MKKVYIIGAIDFAYEVTQYITDNNEYEILGYFEQNKKIYASYNYKAPYLGVERDFSFLKNDNVIIAIADVNTRYRIFTYLQEKEINFPTFIHKSAFVSKSSIINESSILCPFVCITSNAKIGKNFHANIYSYVAHDCVIGENVTFAPAVKCNGNVIIEDNVYIGTNAVIHPGKPNKPLIIGKNSIIAAGSVVTKSIKENTTVFGNPAIQFTKENLKRRS